MGRVSYDRSWAWRIVYLSLGTLAGSTSELPPEEVVRHMSVENTPVGIRYVRSCLKRFTESGDPWTTRDFDPTKCYP